MINLREVFVHHRPAPAPRSVRLTRFQGRLAGLLRPRRNRGGVRLVLGALVSTVLTALVVAVPVVSSTAGGTPFVALDSFAATSAARTSSHGHSPVVMGLDGEPVEPSTPDGLTTSSGTPGRPTTGAFVGSTTPAPARTPAPAPPAATPAPAPATEAAPAPAVAKAPVAAPAPASAKAPVAAPTPAQAATVATAAPADPSAEGQVLALVNAQRAAAGCGALTADAGLAALARAHSADMRNRHFLGHVDPDGRDPFQRAATAGIVAHAENIAYGQPDAAAVMDAWMNSAGHRANILNCDLTKLGVGVAEGHGGPWWTQDFA